MKIEVGDKVYEVKKPIGRLGAIHFATIAKVAPDIQVNEDGSLKPSSMERIADAFLEWREKVLKHIVSENIEEMEGVDQFGIFIALISETEVSKDLFRIIE